MRGYISEVAIIDESDKGDMHDLHSLRTKLKAMGHTDDGGAKIEYQKYGSTQHSDDMQANVLVHMMGVLRLLNLF